jgi:hypothetical protein
MSAEWPAAEQVFLANCFQPTLNGAIATTPPSGTTETWTLSSAPPAGSPQAFNMQIDAEIVSVTAWTGTSYTLTRGAATTTPTTHLDGATATTPLSLAAGYMGGDEHVTIDLGSGRVLWIWGDPSWATGPGQIRTAPQGHSVLAIQTGYDLSACTLTFYPITNPAGQNFSKFPDEGDSTLCPNGIWPGTGIMLDTNLLILGQRVVGAAGDNNGHTGYLIDNPASTPDLWQWYPVRMWTEQGHGTGFPIFAYNSLADPGDGWLYAWAVNDNVQMYVCRFDRKAVKRQDMTSPQWWCGTALGFNYESRHVRRQTVRPSQFLAREASQHLRTDGQWQLTCTDDSAHIQYALTNTPGSMFPALTNAYTIDTTPHQGLNYMAIAHPEQTWAGKNPTDVLVTYTAYLGDTIYHRPLLYWPKIVQLTGL